MNERSVLLAVSASLFAVTPVYAATDTTAKEPIKTFGAPRNLETIRGSGRDVPLYQALAAVVPRDFSVRTAGVSRALLDQPVSWTGGRPWTEVLLDMLSPYPELVVDVSYGARVAIVRQIHPSNPARPPEATSAQSPPPENTTPLPATDPAQRAHARMAETPTVKNATPTTTAPPVAEASTRIPEAPKEVRQEIPMLPNWEITLADKTIKTSLTRWAAAAGWQILWELPVDYPVAAQASISGQFETAIETVVRSLASAEIPVRAVFYQGNHVLRVIAKGVE
jgi:hypothetical protein